jgi:predicted transcriptional regulator
VSDEKITRESWFMRSLWQTTEMNYGAKVGVVTTPKQLKSSGIKSLLERALKAQGLVKPLNKQNNERRQEWKGAHGLCKFYQTTAEKVMKSINDEITMGHNIRVTASYYKPYEDEVLDEYLKAVDLLTFLKNGKILDKKVKDLEEQIKTLIV